MRFLHTADWHIGKRLHGYDLLADQQKVLEDILLIAKEEQVDAIVIAGDLYDRSVPAIEAVHLLNQQLYKMNLSEHFPVLAISGNHDSATRLETGAPWFQQNQFYLRTQLTQAFQPIELADVQFYLLPYFEPIAARLYFEDEAIRTIQQAMPLVIAEMKKTFDATKKQVLVSHFFVAGSSRTDSETKVEVGGLDSVPLDLLEVFDYVALGHLHGKNALQHPTICYSGSPLKFSLSELHQEKGVWIVDTDPTVIRRFREVAPLRDMVQVTASFQELLTPAFYHQLDREAYLQLLLTDRAIIPNMMNQLRQLYPRILSVERLNGREQGETPLVSKAMNQLAPQELLTNFFEKMTDSELTVLQQRWLSDTLSQVEGAEQ